MFIEIFKSVLAALRSAFRSRAALLAENAVLRQQIIALRRSVPKPRIRARDRVVLALAARLFGTVLKVITIVRPETVVRWHRSFWRLIWRKKSGRPVGRPPADADLRTMIRRQQETASSWSTPSQSSNGKSAFLRLRCSPVQRVLANRLDRDADNLNLGPDPIRGIGGVLATPCQRPAT